MKKYAVGFILIMFALSVEQAYSPPLTTARPASHQIISALATTALNLPTDGILILVTPLLAEETFTEETVEAVQANYKDSI